MIHMQINVTIIIILEIFSCTYNANFHKSIGVQDRKKNH